MWTLLWWVYSKEHPVVSNSSIHSNGSTTDGWHGTSTINPGVRHPGRLSKQRCPWCQDLTTRDDNNDSPDPPSSKLAIAHNQYHNLRRWLPTVNPGVPRHQPLSEQQRSWHQDPTTRHNDNNPRRPPSIRRSPTTNNTTTCEEQWATSASHSGFDWDVSQPTRPSVRQLTRCRSSTSPTKASPRWSRSSCLSMFIQNSTTTANFEM